MASQSALLYTRRLFTINSIHSCSAVPRGCGGQVKSEYETSAPSCPCAGIQRTIRSILSLWSGILEGVQADLSLFFLLVPGSLRPISQKRGSAVSSSKSVYLWFSSAEASARSVSHSGSYLMCDLDLNATHQEGRSPACSNYSSWFVETV